MKTTSTTRSKASGMNMALGLLISLLLILSSLSCAWASTEMSGEQANTPDLSIEQANTPDLSGEQADVAEEAAEASDTDNETVPMEETETVETENPDSLELQEPAVTESRMLDNVLDEILITSARDESVCAKWTAADPANIETSKVMSAESLMLRLNWSVKYDGAPVKAGDYFTVTIPNEGVFKCGTAKYTGGIMDGSETIATYSAANDGKNIVITITFTDYVERYNNVNGSFWCGLKAETFTNEAECGLTFTVSGRNAAGMVQVIPR